MAERGRGTWNWLVEEYQWPYAALFGGLCLLAIVPVLWSRLDAALLLVYLQLPVYMVHQFEEHARDRFRHALNEQMAGGRDALTRTAAFWINSALVWGPLLAGLYLAAAWGGIWSLVGTYLLIVNALIHIVNALVLRRYNPGLITAVLLLLPLGVMTLRETALPFRAHLPAHISCALVIVALHAWILVHVKLRARLLQSYEA